MLHNIQIYILLGDINTSAILHLASTVPKKLQFSATDFNSYNTVKSGKFLSPEIDGVRTNGGQKMTVPKTHPGKAIIHKSCGAQRCVLPVSFLVD